MLSASLQQIEAIPICSFSCLLGLKLIIGLGEGIPREVECGVASSLNMLGMIILGFRIFKMRLLVDGMVVIIVIEWIDFIGLSSS